MSEHTQAAAEQPPSGPPVRQMGTDSAPAPSVPLRPASPRPEGDVTPAQRRAPFCLTTPEHNRICGRPAAWHSEAEELARCSAGHLIDLTGEQS